MTEPDKTPKPYTEGVSRVGFKGCLQIFIVLGVPILILLYLGLQSCMHARWE
jgi:hypothetical protein